MLEPPVWGRHYEKALKNFEESAEAGEARGAFMLGKILLLWSEREADAAIGMGWLEKAAAMGYKIAEEFLDFYRTFGKPITRQLLEAVTLDTGNGDLLCLAGQLKFFDTPFDVFPKEAHPKTLEGIELLEKAAELGHPEAARFLFEAYFGYFWQVLHDSEKAKYYLEKYLALTGDALERAELDNFEYACQRMMKSRRELLFYTRGRVCSQGMPENRGSLDDSFYDKFRENT
ncbi:MAG: sel1 repeat family protein [Oscillospiraceae bacterium]|nr:sel1 repeat family protein [Oscillospiraceae bacterium]MBQ9929697.1 sel1 repeat family protein [Oscillospiraceae bacterium]